MRMIEHIHRPSAIHVKPSAKNIQSCHVPYPLSNQYDSLYTLNEVHLCAAFYSRNKAVQFLDLK